MTKREGKNDKSGVNITGNVDTGGGDIAGRDIKKRDVNQTQGLQPEDVHELFASIYELIEQKSDLSNDDKNDLKDILEEVSDEAVKGEEADEKKLGRNLRIIARMAPDILDVTLKTIANPVLGLAAVAQKIASKANKEDSGETESEKKTITRD
jgi:hypothetical protein